jgi:hypothetical protein
MVTRIRRQRGALDQCTTKTRKVRVRSPGGVIIFVNKFAQILNYLLLIFINMLYKHYKVFLYLKISTIAK